MEAMQSGRPVTSALVVSGARAAQAAVGLTRCRSHAVFRRALAETGQTASRIASRHPASDSFDLALGCVDVVQRVRHSHPQRDAGIAVANRRYVAAMASASLCVPERQCDAIRSMAALRENKGRTHGSRAGSSDVCRLMCVPVESCG